VSREELVRDQPCMVGRNERASGAVLEAIGVARIEVNGTHLYVEDKGAGPAVVLLHGVRSDARVWDFQFDRLAEEFRAVRYDARTCGRSEYTAQPVSPLQDLRELLDVLGIQTAAIVGLASGARVAIDFALTWPRRVWALVAAAPGLSGYDFDPYTAELARAIDRALAAGDIERIVELDLSVWASMAPSEEIKEMARANVHALFTAQRPLELEQDSMPARGRLGEIDVPTLVVTGSRDVPAINVIGGILEHEIRNATAIELDSDHYIPLRQPEAFAKAVLDFLKASRLRAVVSRSA
jgi:3-oxoadipate enol-lactonase